MHVANSRPDPQIEAVLSAICGSEQYRVALIAGAPGLGKSSVLAAALERVRRDGVAKTVWISGGIVAGEEHFDSLLADAAGCPEKSTQPLASLLTQLADRHPQLILGIDDLDVLLFKREALATRLAASLAENPGIQLIASCHPVSRDRWLRPSHPVFAATKGRVAVVTLAPMDFESALSLIRHRVPVLSTEGAHEVIRAAGGHPSALVFLARMLELRPTHGRDELAQIFERAAEFAGTVYSESWASLGPQQRAVLWALSMREGTTAGQVAANLRLSPSHVSAQITRLVADGLVQRGETRGQYNVPPLLSGWIARRAVRTEVADGGNSFVALRGSKKRSLSGNGAATRADASPRVARL